MHNVNATLQPLRRNPGALPPITQQELQRQAWSEVAAMEARDHRYHRALQLQVQQRVQ